MMIELEELKAFAIAQRTIWRTLSNESRVKILYKLYEGDSTWSDLMFSLKINPKSLSSHLNFLIEYQMVEKNNGDYTLTEFGGEVCELRVFEEIKSMFSNQDSLNK